MRTFQRGEDRFWTIDRQGLSITVTFGKVGGKGQTRKSTTTPEADARRMYQRMIRDKVRAGYVETTPPSAPLPAPGLALEAALVANPDDRSAHLALADWLSQQSDRQLQLRGEFIRVQLALEDTNLSAAERRKLEKKQKQLRADNESNWVDYQLADYLYEGGGDELYLSFTEGCEISRDYQRGWLSRLQIPHLSEPLAVVLAGSPCLRLLRELEIDNVLAAGNPIAPLTKAGNLSNLRKFTLGNCDAECRVDEVIRNLPRIEEVHLFDAGLEPGTLFSLPNLKNLRVLEVVEAARYPIRELANNPALIRLEELRLSPPGLQEDDEPHLRLAAIRALVRSKHMPALKRLTLHRSDMGDAGCREIADSGILGRLLSLDLTNGCISDEGARILAGGKEFGHLQRLILTGNRLTSEGMRILQRKDLTLVADAQQETDAQGHYEDLYLYDANQLDLSDSEYYDQD